jgi:hypothetical protein
MRAFILPVFPSVWGWNAIDNRRSTPSRLHCLFQNTAAKWGLRSEITVFGNPCNLTTSFKNISANPQASMVVPQGTKCLIFDNRSATTQIASYPSHSSNLVTKSIDISAQGFSGNGRGGNTPKLACLLVRDLWHSAQCLTYQSTCLLIVFQL